MIDRVSAKHYKELLVWQKGMSLAKGVYGLTAKFPTDERFGLVSQNRHRLYQCLSYFAQGQARHGTPSFCSFYLMPAFAAELETQLLLSVDMKYCSEKDVESAAGLIIELQKMIAALRRSLEGSLVTSH